MIAGSTALLLAIRSGTGLVISAQQQGSKRGGEQLAIGLSFAKTFLFCLLFTLYNHHGLLFFFFLLVWCYNPCKQKPTSGRSGGDVKQAAQINHGDEL